jgi:hypothetical protein
MEFKTTKTVARMLPTIIAMMACHHFRPSAMRELPT